MKIEMVFVDYGIRKCKDKDNKYGFGNNYLIYWNHRLINKDVIKEYNQRRRYKKYWKLDD